MYKIPSISSEIVLSEVTEELEAVRRLVKYLQEYLENLRVFRKDLNNVNTKCEQLMKVNIHWIDIVKTMNDLQTVPYTI